MNNKQANDVPLWAKVLGSILLVVSGIAGLIESIAGLATLGIVLWAVFGSGTWKEAVGAIASYALLHIVLLLIPAILGWPLARFLDDDGERHEGSSAPMSGHERGVMVRIVMVGFILAALFMAMSSFLAGVLMLEAPDRVRRQLGESDVSVAAAWVAIATAAFLLFGALRIFPSPGLAFACASAATLLGVTYFYGFHVGQPRLIILTGIVAFLGCLAWVMDNRRQVAGGAGAGAMPVLPLQTQAQGNRFCLWCRTALQPDARVCPNCGTINEPEWDS